MWRWLIKTIVLLFIAFFISLSNGYSQTSSFNQKESWKAEYLWRKVESNPSTEVSANFYYFICKFDRVGDYFIDQYLIDNYRFNYEILCGNRYIAMAALRLMKSSTDDQRKKMARTIAKLIRINPELFLDILQKEKEFKIDMIKQCVVSLPVEIEYLFRKSFLFSEDVSEKLSYFAFYEIGKRIEALERIKTKRYEEIKRICLDLLNKEMKELRIPKSYKIDFGTEVDILKFFWTLAREEQWLIFDEPLPGDECDFDLKRNFYFESVLLPIFRYESFAGNMLALRFILFEVRETRLTERSTHLWEISRINPESFVRVLCGSEGEKVKKNNIFLCPTYDELSTQAKIAELGYRIDALKKMRFKEKNCKEVKKLYLDKFKKLKKLYSDISKKQSEIMKIIEMKPDSFPY